MSTRSALSLLLLATLSACISTEERQVVLGAPLELKPAASRLLGAGPDRYAVLSRDPIADVPLTTRLVTKVASRASKAVVSIYTRSSTPARVRLIPFRFMPGFEVHVPGESLGTGFFIHPSGLLLSNEHVVAGAQEIWAQTSDGEQLKLEVLAVDPTFDLALLAVVGPEREYPALPLGDSEQVAIGDQVLAIGNPLGLGHTVTMGIISYTSRDLAAAADDKTVRRPRYLQTDTAINRGNSGGPLITLDGVCVGVNTAILGDAQGIGFSVPSAQAFDFLQAVAAGAWPQSSGGTATEKAGG